MAGAVHHGLGSVHGEHLTKEIDMAKNTKTTATDKSEEKIADAVLAMAASDEAAAEEPKVGKVEARLAALEAYVKHNVKALGWPEFKG